MDAVLTDGRHRARTSYGLPQFRSELDEETFDSVKLGKIIPQRDREEAALIRHLEADPSVIAYRAVHPKELPKEVARTLQSVPVFAVEHAAGPFVLALDDGSKPGCADALLRLDSYFAHRGRWLYVRNPTWLFSGNRWRNVQAIVASRFELVPYGERIVLLHEIDRAGELELLDCANQISCSRPIEAVLSLATRSDIFFDLDAPLTLATLIRTTPTTRVL